MASTSQKSTILPGRSALHGRAATITANPNGGKPGLVFYEMAHLGKINLRTDKSAGKMIKTITGCAFPPAANKFTSAGERHAVWLGPDEFLLLCEAGKDEDLTRAIQTALGSRHSAVTNISDALAAFQLKAPPSDRFWPRAVRLICILTVFNQAMPRKLCCHMPLLPSWRWQRINLSSFAAPALPHICMIGYAMPQWNMG